MAKRPRRLQGKLLDACEETFCRLGRLDKRTADSGRKPTRHLGAYGPGVKTDDRDATFDQISSQTDPCHVRRRLGHTIAVQAAREVFAERAHAAGDDRHLRSFAETPEKRL